MIGSFTWFGIKGRKKVGIFRLHEPKEITGFAFGSPDLPRLRLFRDWRTDLHKRRRSLIPMLIRREAGLKHIISFITTGDSGNIPQYEDIAQ